MIMEMNVIPLATYFSMRDTLSPPQILLVEEYLIPGLKKQAENISKMKDCKTVVFVAEP